MKLHANAALSWSGRRLLCDRVLGEGWTLAAAAEAAGVSVRCARKWVSRFRVDGEQGILDRSSALLPRGCDSQSRACDDERRSRHPATGPTSRRRRACRTSTPRFPPRAGAPESVEGRRHCPDPTGLSRGASARPRRHRRPASRPSRQGEPQPSPHGSRAVTARSSGGAYFRPASRNDLRRSSRRTSSATARAPVRAAAGSSLSSARMVDPTDESLLSPWDRMVVVTFAVPASGARSSRPLRRI